MIGLFSVLFKLNQNNIVVQWGAGPEKIAQVDWDRVRIQIYQDAIIKDLHHKDKDMLIVYQKSTPIS